MKKIYIMMWILAGLVACDPGDDDGQEERTARRTVLVYMAAENNLASFCTSDLEEIKAGSKALRNDQNLVVYVDRAGAEKTPYLARVRDGELVDTLYLKEGLAADPAVLESVIRSTKDHYPAKSYGLVLWGHASGWLVSKSDSISKSYSRAYGGSTGNNTSTGAGKYWMNIVPMAKAIGSALGADRFQFVFGDCCEFGCIEIAHELRHVTAYTIGSPTEIPDTGAPFQLVIPDLFNETDNFYEQIVNDYYNYYMDIFQTQGSTYYNRQVDDLAGHSVPLAVIKSSELDNLAQETARVVRTMPDKLMPPGSLDLYGIMYYATTNGYRYSYDMCQVLRRNASAEAYNSWLSAFLKAVPYRTYSRKWMTNSTRLMNDMESFIVSAEECGGVSMFFPSSYYQYTSPNMNQGIQTFQWNEEIKWGEFGW